MGGSNQATMAPPAASSVATGKGTAIRFHEDNGVFHFHDDKAGTKVEVPSNDFTSAWNGPGGLSEQAGDWMYTDLTNGLILNIRTFMDNGEWDVEMSINEPKKSANFAALTKLITG